jgi:hypothetical protein
MNQSTIERFIIATDNTPKGQIKGKKVSGNKQRKTELYWSDVNRIMRKKEKRVRYDTHRIPIQTNEQDDTLENIHYANYLGQKDIRDLPEFHSEDTITISKRTFPAEEEFCDHLPVFEEEGESSNGGYREDRLYMRLPAFKGNPEREESYKNLQRKYMAIIDSHSDYMEQMFAYECEEYLSDEESIRSYESRY